MESLRSRHVLLGVTGGIAAYKAAELVRLLREAGAEVRVAMTEAAQAFVSPLTFQALSGQRVATRPLDPEAEAAMGHIELARWADVVLVAPASADFLARLAHGLADDLLATLCLATETPVAVAPAMNKVMWEQPATRANRERLTTHGVHLLGPGHGGQACGEVGAGRMLEPRDLVQGLAALLTQPALTGTRVLITAGPTREPLDPVRFLGNRSSGRMGYALAAAGARAGAAVQLVSGPVALPAPPGVERIEVETAGEMYEAVMARVEDCDLFIAAAAVSDYRVAETASQKIKRSDAPMTLELVPNPDILAAVAALPGSPFTVGFAAETEALEAHARAKLQDKGVDMVAANRVGQGVGFEAQDNALEVFWPGGEASLPRMAKDRLAEELIQLIARRYREGG